MSCWHEMQHKARKRFQCAGCLGFVEVGEQYTRWTGMTDGKFGTDAYHVSCRDHEIELNHRANLRSDEWTPLHEWVDDDRAASLDGAPADVIERFAGDAR